MTPQEAQQAQTIAVIREMQKQRDRWRGEKTVPVQQLDMLLEIVDSQAQKIAALTDCVEAGHKVMSDQAQKIAEARQAAEVLRARYTARIAGDSQAKHYERADLLFPWEKL